MCLSDTGCAIQKLLLEVKFSLIKNKNMLKSYYKINLNFKIEIVFII